MNTLRVKPAAGLLVRAPDTREPLPAAGAEVPATPYWLRRLADGDVTLQPPPASRPARSNRSSS